MISAGKSLFWHEKSDFARLRPKLESDPENPRVGGSIPPLATTKSGVRSQDFGNTLAEVFLANRRSYGVCPSRAPWGLW